MIEKKTTKEIIQWSHRPQGQAHSVYDKIQSKEWISVEDVEKHTLDKKRVKEVLINKLGSFNSKEITCRCSECKEVYASSKLREEIFKELI